MSRPAALFLPLVTAFVATFGVVTVAHAAVAHEGLDRYVIVPNSSGTLTGHDFPPSETLELSSDPSLTVPATVDTDATGHVTIPYSLAADAPTDGVRLTAVHGDYVWGGGLLAGSPELVRAGSDVEVNQSGTLHLTARGFAADEALAVTCTCTLSTSDTTTDATGSVVFDARVAGPRWAHDLVLAVTAPLSHRNANLGFRMVTASATGAQEISSVGSPNGMFRVDMNNLTFSTRETIGIDNGAWWTSGPGGAGDGHLFLQSDGNLVLRDGAGRALWQSRTVGAGPNASLTMQDDGNIVLRSPQGRALWSSGTWLTALRAGQTMRPGAGLRGFAYLDTMQTDGNLVQRDDEQPEYRSGALWSTGIKAAGSSLTLQMDGNLVMRAPSGQAVWSTGTSGRCPSPVLTQQFDQNLVLRSSTTGRACWATGAARFVN